MHKLTKQPNEKEDIAIKYLECLGIKLRRWNDFYEVRGLNNNFRTEKHGFGLHELILKQMSAFLDSYKHIETPQKL